eukprot:m.494600 g.494600  ORF g.494600 m.494600 type:complete len:302 (-) comp21796_c1_seq14:1123-2028(-)
MPKKKASASNASSPAKTSIVDVADDVIDGQPKKSDTRTTRKSEAGAALDTSAAEPIKDFMRNLKVEEIAKWDAPTVAQAFLTALGLPRLMQPFLDHKITGAVLLELTKTDLYDIGFPPDSHRQRRVSDKCSITIGERAYLWTMILELKKKSRRADRDREIWAVRTPEGPVQYYDGCYQCIQYRCCRCAMGHTHYDLSGLGLEVVHKAPTFCGCCIGEFRDNKDMRFLKDIDGFSIYGPCPFCCYKKKGIILHFHDDDDDMRPAEDRTNSLSERVTIYHPYMTDENVLKMTAVWAELRLVDG